MVKIRRDNYVFVTWIGDHSPRHVHVYRDGKLIVKWDLDNDIAMKGEINKRIRVIIENLRKEKLI